MTPLTRQTIAHVIHSACLHFETTSLRLLAWKGSRCITGRLPLRLRRHRCPPTPHASSPGHVLSQPHRLAHTRSTYTPHRPNPPHPHRPARQAPASGPSGRRRLGAPHTSHQTTPHRTAAAAAAAGAALDPAGGGGGGDVITGPAESDSESESVSHRGWRERGRFRRSITQRGWKTAAAVDGRRHSTVGWLRCRVEATVWLRW